MATFAAMFAGGSLLGFLGVAFPLSDKTPVELDAVCSVIALGIAATAFFVAGWVPEWVLKAGAALGILMIGLVVSRSATPQGIMLIGFTYLWVAIYVAVFFSRRTVLAVAVFVGVTFGAAILVNGMGNLFTCWLIVTITVAVCGLTLNHQSLRQRELALTDPLTGLLNRNGLFQAAARELSMSARTGRPLTIAVIDLDGFKAINDRYGHLAGDEVLVELAKSWGSKVRASDVLARTGGDEFVLLLPATEERDAPIVLERLREAKDIAWSVGTTSALSGDDFDDCLARADHALYGEKARRAGRPATTPARIGSIATVEG